MFDAKKNLGALLCAALGLFNFIFFALPYLSISFKMDLGGFGGGAESSALSGYQILGDIWEGGGFFGVLVGICQWLILLVGIAMLAVGACALLKEMGIVPQLPDGVMGKSFGKLSILGLFGGAVLYAAQLVFIIFYSLFNSKTESMSGMSASVSFGPAIGFIIALVLFAGAFGGYVYLQKKNAETPSESAAE